MSVCYDDNENDGVPNDDALLDAAVAAWKTSPDEVHDALIGLIGLIQIICSRDDLSSDAKAVILTNHRYTSAREVAKSYL